MTGAAFVISIKVATTVCCIDIALTGTGIVIGMTGLVCLISIAMDDSVLGIMIINCS